MTHKIFLPRSSTRRQFLSLLGTAAAGTFLAGCRPAPTSAPTPLPSPSPTPAVTATSASSEPWKPLAQVALARQASYERKAVRAAVQGLLDELWHWQAVLPWGAKVALKVNLTRGPAAYKLDGTPAVEAIATHPEVVRALAELLLDAGAARIYIVEALDDDHTFSDWGYTEIAKSLGATLIDLNKPDPYPDFAAVPVPGHLIYESLTLNRLLTEVDTFVSLAKLKCHSAGGLTASMMNLLGLVPLSQYRLNPADTLRTDFHQDIKRRLPRAIVDLNLARPVHLALIDAIKTVEGGEGTWVEGLNPVSPGLLLAGTNALATDSVAASLIGFDPTARYPKPPFTQIDNYLHLGSTLGLGTNLLESIDLRGPALETLRFPFQPAAAPLQPSESVS